MQTKTSLINLTEPLLKTRRPALDGEGHFIQNLSAPNKLSESARRA
jgi:hypothetical protein